MGGAAGAVGAGAAGYGAYGKKDEIREGAQQSLEKIEGYAEYVKGKAAEGKGYALQRAASLRARLTASRQ